LYATLLSGNLASTYLAKHGILLNHFLTVVGPCCAGLRKWGLVTSDLCSFGHQQTVGHFIFP